MRCRFLYHGIMACLKSGNRGCSIQVPCTLAKAVFSSRKKSPAASDKTRGLVTSAKVPGNPYYRGVAAASDAAMRRKIRRVRGIITKPVLEGLPDARG